MTTNEPHARAFDLPGWPCPPRVRDIPNNQDSWGYVYSGSVAQDELGYLWVNGDAVPAFCNYLKVDNPGAIVFWTDAGIGLHMHPKSLGHLGSISRLDMKPGEWLPVASVVAELPGFVKAAL